MILLGLYLGSGRGITNTVSLKRKTKGTFNTGSQKKWGNILRDNGHLEMRGITSNHTFPLDSYRRRVNSN